MYDEGEAVVLIFYQSALHNVIGEEIVAGRARVEKREGFGTEGVH